MPHPLRPAMAALAAAALLLSGCATWSHGSVDRNDQQAAAAAKPTSPARVTLTEGDLAGLRGLADPLRREGLADGQQTDIFDRSSRQLRRCGDTRPDGLQVGGNCCHNALKNRGKYIIAPPPPFAPLPM